MSKEEDIQEALDRKKEWLAHECTERLRRRFDTHRKNVLINLLASARESTDPDVRGHALKLESLEHIIVELGLQNLGA